MKNQQNYIYIDWVTLGSITVRVRQLYFIFSTLFRLVNQISIIISIIMTQLRKKQYRDLFLSKMDKWRGIVIISKKILSCDRYSHLFAHLCEFLSCLWVVKSNCHGSLLHLPSLSCKSHFILQFWMIRTERDYNWILN